MKLSNRFISVGLCVMMALISIPVSAQITLQGGGGVDLVIPQGDYSGSMIDYYTGSKYGLTTGYGLHAKARAGLLGFTVAAEVAYSHLSNSGDAVGGGTMELTHNIISLAAGPEYHISVPALPVEPYAGVLLGLNSFSGENTLKGISGIQSGTIAIESATRFGITLRGGGIITIGPAMKLDIGLSYAMMNLAGAAWTDPQPTKDAVEDSFGGLNDEADPFISLGGAKHFIANSRSINALRFSATLMFGL